MFQTGAGAYFPVVPAFFISAESLDAGGRDEAMYLAPLERVVASGRTLADEQLALYHGSWHGDVSAVFREYAF